MTIAAMESAKQRAQCDLGKLVGGERRGAVAFPRRPCRRLPSLMVATVQQLSAA